MTRSDRTPEPVTVVLARAVTGGHEDEFHRWAHRLTATVIVVLQTLVSTLLHPLVGDWPTFPRTVAVILPVVATMTWLVMPRLSQWLRGWLYPDSPSSG